MTDMSETRLAVVEREVALVGQRFEDLRQRVNDMADTARTVTRLEVAAANLQSEVLNIRRDLAERDKEASSDRRSARAALYTLGAGIIITIVGAVITVLIATGGVR